jgi:hypothetical protein
MLRRSGLASLRAVCSLSALSVVLTLALASAAFAQLLPEPTLSINDVTVTEGNTGTTNATFTVTRSGDTSLLSTVNYATADDTATQPGDYASSSGTLTFNAGETTKTVTVSVNGDTLDEADETFLVNLSTPVGATISDGQGVGTITDDDETPQANDDGSAASPITLSEDDPGGVTINVLANDSGLGDQPITVTATNGSKGTVIVNPANTVTYTPNDNENGDDTFTYTVRDADEQSSTATVFVRISPANDAPDAVNDSATTDEDTPVDVNVKANDTDLEGDTLTVTDVFDPANGTATINPDGTVRYVPDADFNGIDSFTYTINDGNGGTDTATVTVTVTPVNDAPTATNDSKTVAEDGTLTFPASDLTANDSPGPANEGGQTLSVTAVGSATIGSVSLNNGNVTFTPTANYFGPASFEYTVCDDGRTNGQPDSKCDTGTVNVAVTAVNDPPTANDDSETVAEDDTLVFDPSVDDSPGPPNESGQTLRIDAITAPAAHGTAEIITTGPDAGKVRYTPNPNYSGPDSFDYRVCDDGQTNGADDPKCDTATVTIMVTAVNDAPEANDDAYNTDEDMQLTVSAPGVLGNDTDVEGDNLGATVLNDADNGVLTLNSNGSFTYTPNSDFNGTDSFTYTVSDGNGGTDTATVSITVRAVDGVAPTVIKVAPTGKKVSLRANVVATFSEAMMRSSLNKTTVKLVKKGTTRAVVGTLSYPAPNKVVLNPKRNLVRGAIYTVTIMGGASGAKDVAGNALAANKVWKFRVR